MSAYMSPCVYAVQAGATLFTIPAVVAFEGASALWPPAHPNWKKSIGKFDHAGTIITERFILLLE